MPLYMNNIYRVSPNSSRVIFEQSSGIFPESFKRHVVYNVGRTEVYAETIYGTAIGWIGNAGSATVQPKETKTINNGGRSYYRVGLKIHNKTNIPAIVCAEYDNGARPGGNEGDINLDYNAIIKKLVVAGIKSLQHVGPSLSGLLEAFWPVHKPNVWEEMKDKVKDLIDDSIRDAVNAILSGDIRQYKERIKVLEENLNLKKDVASYYMNLAQDMVGLELKFTYPENLYNSFVLLPLYSAVVMLKMNYYVTGIVKAKELGISDQNVEDITKLANRLIEHEDGVANYINKMYKKRLDSLYNSWDVKDIYNAMMNTRSYIAVHGLEYIPVWRQMLKHPSSTIRPYVDTVSYSEFYGRVTPNLCREATPEELKDPLTPKLADGKRNKMTGVELYMWRINRGAGAPKIGGLKVFFENGDNHMMGYYSNETHYIDFKGAHLDKLRVGGSEALDTFTFYFSDGRKATYGTESDTHTVFELKDHYIASMFLSNDDLGLGGQAANVAVSYLQN